MNIDSRIRAVQRALGLEPDGCAGPKTWEAIHARIVGTQAPTAPDEGIVDARSERMIATLLPEVRTYARALVHAARVQGIEVRIISGTRTYAQQDELYARGRTTSGPRVTNSRGGYSNHNFGIAFDVGIFENQTYLEESPAYKAVGAMGKSLGLEWGGDWRSFIDEPHFQLRPGWAAGLTERDMLAELRRRKDSGRPVFD